MWILLLLLLIVLVALNFILKSTDKNNPAFEILSNVKKVGWVSFFCLFVLVFIFKCFVQVPSGKVGVVTLWGKVTGVLQPGGHFINPLSERALMDTRLQAVSDEHSSGSADMQEVTVKCLVNWSIDPTKAGTIYSTIGSSTETIETRVIQGAVQETLKQELSRYPVGDILVKRSGIKSNIEKSLRQWLGRYNLILSDVSIQNISFNDAYQKAIEEKQVQQQKALALQYTLEQTRKNAEIAVAQAKGEADAKRERANGEAAYNEKVASSITPALLQQKQLEIEMQRIIAWKQGGAQVPQIMSGSNNGMIFQLPPLSQEK